MIEDNCQDTNEEKVLQDLTSLDEVSGINKNEFIKSIIDSYLQKDKKNNFKSVLLIVGLENFKYINDTFGSECGDLFVKTIFKELKSNIIRENLIYRFEGNELLIFINNFISVNDIEEKVKSVIGTFNKSYNIGGNKIYVETSVGIAVYPDNGLDFETLLRNADTAIYMARDKGKNKYQFFNDSIEKKLDRYYKIQNGLTTAIEKNEMYVVFQPKVILAHNKVNGFEALLRWGNKEFGLVRPSEFIPIAESTGYIIPIGNFVFREVFKKIKLLLDGGYKEFKIAVNLSYIQLRDGNVVEYIKELCEEYEIDGRYLEFEVTEGILIKSYEHTIKCLNELKEIGATIALDDFGTGYSSLNYLTKLPIDSLKIDRSFVVDLVDDHKSRWVVEKIIELSHKLGIEVIAEGVELEEQVDYLKSILCDIVQGYFYSKPQLFEKVVRLLEK